MSVEVVDDGAVRRITLARPEKRNAMTIAMFDAVTHAVEGAVADDAVRVVVIRGRGDHFCAGAEIGTGGSDRDEKPAKPRTGHLQRNLRASPHRMVRTLFEAEIPIVTGVQGYAAGIGNALGVGGRPRGRDAIRTVLGAVRGPRLHARQRHDVPPPPADRRRPRQGDDPARQAGRRHARGRVGPREPGGRRRRARRCGRGGRAGVRGTRRPSRSGWPSS